jgi:hypothetical protein
MCESQTVSRQRVQMGRLIRRAAVAAQTFNADIICHDQQDVRLFRSPGTRHAEWQEQSEGANHSRYHGTFRVNKIEISESNPGNSIVGCILAGRVEPC